MYPITARHIRKNEARTTKTRGIMKAMQHFRHMTTFPNVPWVVQWATLVNAGLAASNSSLQASGPTPLLGLYVRNDLM